MATLRIYLLGAARISHNQCFRKTTIGRGIIKLLAYLVLFRKQNHAREYVAGLFWGDSNEDRAHSCLSTALWRLRRVLEPPGVPRGAYLLTTAAGEIGFNKESNYWLDVEQLESHAARILKKPCHALEVSEVREIEKVLKLYAGDLLEGYYEDWALNERERLRSLYLKSQAHLLGYYSHKGDYDSALACGHYILNMDPLREEIHREMMRLYMESGRRARAIQQYETIRNLLEAELKVPPMEETRLLRNQIVERSASEPAPSCFHGNPDTLHQTLQQIYEALRDLDKVGKKLGRTAAHLEEFINH